MFSLIQSKQVHYLVPLLPAISLLIARLMTGVQEKNSIISELILPISLCVLGLVLLFMPYIPALAKLAWVQATDSIWGGCIFCFGLLLCLITYYQKRLSIVLASSIIVCSILISFICFFKYTGLAYNLQPAADRVSDLQKIIFLLPMHINIKVSFNFLVV